MKLIKVGVKILKNQSKIRMEIQKKEYKVVLQPTQQQWILLVLRLWYLSTISLWRNKSIVQKYLVQGNTQD